MPMKNVSGLPATIVFRLGTETEVLRRSNDKDIDGQQLVDLRRMLATAGYDAIAAQFEAEGKEA